MEKIEALTWICYEEKKPPQIYCHLYFSAASVHSDALTWSPALLPHRSAGSQEGSHHIEKPNSSQCSWKILLVLTQDISRWSFRAYSGVFCFSQALSGAAKLLLTHSFSASSQTLVPQSHTSPFHFVSFSPLLVTQHSVCLKEGATSVPLNAFMSFSPPTLAANVFVFTPITKDGNNAEETCPSQDIIVNGPGSLSL